MTTAVAETDLLSAWEGALPLSRRERALWLAELIDPDPLLADRPIGVVDSLLLDLHERCFGPQLDCLVTCPQCVEDLDVTLDVAELRFAPAKDTPRRIDPGHGPLQVRALTTTDLLVTGDRVSLVRRCVVGGDVDAGDLAAIEPLLDELDPQGVPVVDIDCPMCHTCWQAPVDIAEFVWQEIDRTARATLADVHELASAYGWREADVLALGPVRRGYYLQAVQA